MTVNHEG